MTKPLLTTKQAAEYLSISTQMVRRFVRLGVLSAVKYTDYLWRFKTDDLDAFIASREKQSRR